MAFQQSEEVIIRMDTKSPILEIPSLENSGECYLHNLKGNKVSMHGISTKGRGNHKNKV